MCIWKKILNWVMALYRRRRSDKHAHQNLWEWKKANPNVIFVVVFVVQSLSHIWLFAALWTAAHQVSLSFTISWRCWTHVHWVCDAIQPFHPLLSSSPPAFNISQHQVKVTQLCPTLCDSMESVHLIVQANILEWDAISFSRGSSQPRDWSQVFHIAGRFFTIWATREAFPTSGSFLFSPLFSLGGQSIGTSASATVLPMNIQDWFPLGWIGFISLQPKGVSRVFSNTTVQRHQFFSSQPFLWSNTWIHTWLLEKS